MDKISEFEFIKNGFVCFNSKAMPPIGTKIKVEYEDLTQDYRFWYGDSLFNENGSNAIFYRISDEDKQIEKLMDLFFNIQSNLVYGYYGYVYNCMQVSLEENNDVNELKIILIATKKVKDHPNLKAVRDKIREKLEYLLGKKLV